VTNTTDLIEQQAASLAAKDKEIERLTRARDDLRQLYQGCDHLRDHAERALAEAVGVMKKIAEHPDKYDDGKRSYAIGWAFWNIQGMARAFVAQHGSDSRDKGE
jgi:N-methylhydantoinase B/oxoprolinase/acetone carboxylase alpha subunit